MTNDFSPSRAGGLRRLFSFTERAGYAYAQGRNYDMGRDQPGHVSMLSPYLRYRLITEEEVIRAVLDRHSATVAEKYIQEVLWRTYWKGWLEHHPCVWKRYLIELDDQRENFRDVRAIKDAENGRTGIDGFDAWAIELKETGYLHNHARMWFASIWIFTLGLPWALGAHFFMRYLIDADPASNTLSWRWVAGLQTPGKTYLATTENIVRYTNGRFAPKGLASTATALTEAPIETISQWPARGSSDQPASYTLLLTHEDMSPESLAFGEGSVESVIICTDTSVLWGPRAQEFVKAAAVDLARRASDVFQCPSGIVDTLDARHLMDAMQASRSAHIVTPYVPTGPIADTMDRLALELHESGFGLSQSLRLWDERLWPHARAGFFSFRKTIPPILKEFGIV